MIKIALFFSTLLMLPVSAVSISINDTVGVVTNFITLSSGASIPNGTALIRLGYFNVSAQAPTWASDLNSTDIPTINSALASFVVFGEGTANLGDVPAAGSQARFATRGGVPSRIIGGVQNITSISGPVNTISPLGVPGGSRIFMLVYSDLNSTLNVGEEFGVFSSSNWLVDTDNSAASVIFTTDVDASEVFRGSVGSLRLAPVPEPTTSVFTAGALALAFRRRRASK